ncbi:MAG: multicopper oxidase domain-containing protein [Hyphomicrobiaceae bacterium]|nr:multicopper oxidase domain-containing protein [Hyphomicrobiaceae bacterium]
MANPYLVGTGTAGPGYYNGGTVNWSATNTGGENFDTFGCKVPDVDPIKTPDWMTATNYFERKVFTDGLWRFPDGKSVKHWGFEDPIKLKGQRLFPSPLIRLREGELAHVKLETRTGPHTIHHHGIEPTTMNDGVGHVSFETSGNYVYQWQPRHAGTWFYHCHVNTVLHFEMGLYGLLIVDPPEGYGYPYKGADRHRYDVEASWVADDVDPKWRDLTHGAGLCGDDVGLNIFKPKYFLVTGVEKTKTLTHPKVAIVATKGKRILIRALNASYSILGIKIGLPCEIISVDGHALGTPERPWSSPKPVPANQEFHLCTAARHDLWIDTSSIAPGTYPVEFTYYDWVTKKIHNAGQGLYEGKARSSIRIV